MPRSKPPVDGQPSTIAGLPARIVSGPAGGSCSAIGGSLSKEVLFPSVPGWQGWLSVEACIAGLDTAAAEADWSAILSSVALTSGSPEPSE